MRGSQRSSAASFASMPFTGGAAAAEGSAMRVGSAGAVVADLGTAKNPVHMMQVRERRSAPELMLKLQVSTRKSSNMAGAGSSSSQQDTSCQPSSLDYSASLGCPDSSSLITLDAHITKLVTSLFRAG